MRSSCNLRCSRKVSWFDSHHAKAFVGLLHVAYGGEDSLFQVIRLPVELEIRGAGAKRQKSVVAPCFVECVLDLVLGLGVTGKNEGEVVEVFSSFIYPCGHRFT